MVGDWGLVSGSRVSDGRFVLGILGVAVVFDVGDVSVTVGFVVDDLSTAIGQENAVRAGGHLAIASLLVTVAVVSVGIVDLVSETVQLWGLNQRERKNGTILMETSSTTVLVIHFRSSSTYIVIAFVGRSRIGCCCWISLRILLGNSDSDQSSDNENLYKENCHR